MSTTIGTCRGHQPSASPGTVSCDAAGAATDSLTCPEEGSGWRIHEAICLRKTGGTGLQIDIFRNWFYEPNLFISSYLVKH